MKQSKALLGLFGITALLASLLLQALPANRALAGQITARSLTLQANGTDGGSKPGGVVNHYFQFTLPTAGNLGSLKIQYCTTAADVGALTCVKPTGLTISTVTGIDDTGSDVTGWSLAALPTNPNDNYVIINRTVNSITANTNIKIQVQGVTNPSATNQTFFARIASYDAADAGGSLVDSGTVAASTANQLNVSGTMPESLVFCTGDNIGLTNSVPDCTTATNNTVAFNQLFSPTSTAFATSQMAASTNAGSGYAITVNGTTLTSGSNTITAMTSADTSKFGISQFGLDLVANDGTAYTNAPNISGNSPFPDSANVAPASNGTNYNARPSSTPNYSTAGTFKYASGDIVADSGFPGSPTGTDAQIYTVSYIVNVPGSQPAGTYSSTITYICTPTF